MRLGGAQGWGGFTAAIFEQPKASYITTRQRKRIMTLCASERPYAPRPVPGAPSPPLSSIKVKILFNIFGFSLTKKNIFILT